MEPEGSLPCPQDTVTFPYPDPEQSSPNPSIITKINVPESKENTHDWFQGQRVGPIFTGQESE